MKNPPAFWSWAIGRRHYRRPQFTGGPVQHGLRSTLGALIAGSVVARALVISRLVATFLARRLTMLGLMGLMTIAPEFARAAPTPAHNPTMSAIIKKYWNTNFKNKVVYGNRWYRMNTYPQYFDCLSNKGISLSEHGKNIVTFHRPVFLSRFDNNKPLLPQILAYEKILYQNFPGSAIHVGLILVHATFHKPAQNKILNQMMQKRKNQTSFQKYNHINRLIAFGVMLYRPIYCKTCVNISIHKKIFSIDIDRIYFIKSSARIENKNLYREIIDRNPNIIVQVASIYSEDTCK